MKILETISSMLERTIIYEHNGIRDSITRPGMISCEKMIEEINEICQNKDAQPGIDIEKEENSVSKEQQEDKTEDAENVLTQDKTLIKTISKKSARRKNSDN